MNGLIKLLRTLRKKPAVVARAFRWQMNNWRNISKPLRFVLFAIFTFIAFFIFKCLGQIEVGTLNQLANAAFFELFPFLLAALLTVWGCAGLLFSLIAAKLGESLLNDPI